MKTLFQFVENISYVPDGVPIKIYRFVAEGTQDKPIIVVDDALEDPKVTDFFLVWDTKEEHDNKYICQYRGKVITARYLNPLSGFSKFSMPLVKKAYPKLFASKIVSVQPMTAPASCLKYLKHLHTSTKSPDDK